MTIQYRLNGTLLTNRIEFPGVEALVSAAFRGEPGTGGVVIDDPDGDLTINGWTPFTVDDTDATPTRVWTGFINQRRDGRGGKYYVSDARVHDCDLQDLNGYLHLAIVRGNSGKRSAETDVARVAYLLTSTALSGFVSDEGLVGTASPISFLADDLRRKYADQVLGAIAPVAGKNFFVYYDSTSGNNALYYNADTATVWAASISVSNDDADVDNSTVFAPSQDTWVERDVQDQVGGVSFGWAGEPVYAQSATTIAAMGLLRDAVVDVDRIGLAATAASEATRYLNLHAGEARSINLSLRLPSSKVNSVLAGQELDVKLIHVEGFTTTVSTRVRRRNARPTGPGWWDVDLELWVAPTAGSDAAVDSGTPTATRARLMGENEDTPNGPTEYGIEWGNTGDAPSGGQPSDPKYGLVDYVDGGTPPPWTGLEMLGDGTITAELVASVIGVESGDQTLTWQIRKNGTMALESSQVTTGGLRFITFECNFSGSIDVVSGDVITAYLLAPNATSTLTIPAGSGSPTHRLLIYGDLTAGAEVPLPYAGDPVTDDVPAGDVDNANTDFTTTHPFIPGTLHVLHDGTDQTDHVISSTPTTGAFTLDYAPSYGSTIRTWYESA